MDATPHAGIDIYGAALRYAEVEQHGDHYRLLRLGSCDFDFNLDHALLGDEDTDPGHLATVAEALGDVFEGSEAATLRITLHPPRCYSFFVPLPLDITEEARLDRLQAEATVLVGAASKEDLHLTVDTVHTESLNGEGEVGWNHVLALPTEAHVRFKRVVETLPPASLRLMLSMHGATAAIGRLARRPEATAAYTLALGWYPTHLEYSILRDGAWYFSHHTPAASPNDTTYYAISLLRRFGLTKQDVEQIYVYGEEAPPAAFAPLERIFRRSVQRLDPLGIVNLSPESFEADFNPEAYAACLGSTL